MREGRKNGTASRTRPAERENGRSSPPIWAARALRRAHPSEWGPIAAPAVAGKGRTGPRVALYSHDTMGLGHMRRNMLIARALAESDLGANVLLIAGAAEAKLFRMPRRVDCLTLPALRKETDGQYHSRSLGLSLQQVVAVRASTICAALEAYAPDVLIVDNVPRGALGELDDALRRLSERGTTRCVLGLRDVLDETPVVRREWRERAYEEAVREFYDAVWVYGDPAVFDPVREYGWSPRTARKVRYVGYLDRRSDGLADTGPDAIRHLVPSAGRFALCMAGGGQDGVPLMRAVLWADLPPHLGCVVVTGPFMTTAMRRALAARAARDERFAVVDFHSEPRQLLARADRVIAMGGYNTLSEILSYEKPALIVPRVQPRQEQWIRARCVQALGLVDILHPRDLRPAALSAWLAQDPLEVRKARNVIDFGGLSRLPQFLRGTLGLPCSAPRGCAGEPLTPVPTRGGPDREPGAAAERAPR